MTEPINLAVDVLTAGRARPDGTALRVLGAACGGLRLSHAELLAAVERRAGGLAGLDLPPGARVLLRLGDGPAFPITFLACAALGLVPVPTPAGATAAELGPLAARLAPALTVAEPGLARPPGPWHAPEALDGPALPIDDWPRGDPERLGYIVLTSGSGGAPKAVAHAHRAIRARRAMHRGWYGLRADDRLLHAGAMNWTFTLGTGLLDPWSAGATALVPAPGTPAAALPEMLARAEATLVAGVPTIFRRMLRAGLPPLPALRHGLTAGERLAPALREAWRAATGTDLHEALGMSECSTYVSGSPDRPAPRGTVGWPQPGRVVRVRDGHLEVAAHEPGLMLGYWEGAAPVLPLRDGWFDSGDLVEAGPDGALIHLGRADDLLNAGGARVAPQEIEAALAGLGAEDLAVGEVEVAGGARVLAAYYVAAAPLDEAAAAALAAELLAPHKRPRLWLRREALPRNANGKLRRRELG
jgi:acyl-coenzyme A synthetase/AMP-(fatty) acid ligase